MKILSTLTNGAGEITLLFTNTEKAIGLIIVVLILLLMIMGIIYLRKKIWE